MKHKCKSFISWHFCIRNRRLKMWSRVPRPGRKPACVLLISLSTLALILFKINFRRILRAWLMRKIVLWFEQSWGSPFFGNVTKTARFQSVGQSHDCQILVTKQWYTFAPVSPLAFISSAVILSQPIDFPFVSWLPSLFHITTVPAHPHPQML